MKPRYWHFIRENKKLGYQDDRIVRAGRTYKVDCEPILCESGLHASKEAIDALVYAPGPIICRVELGRRYSTMAMISQWLLSERFCGWPTPLIR